MSKLPKPSTKPISIWKKETIPNKDQKKEALKILVKAKKLISEKEGWCQNHYALNKEKRAVAPLSKEAVCFCSYGALIASDPDDQTWDIGYHYVIEALKEKVPDDDEPSLQVFNDTKTHEEVIALFDRAIEIAKENY